MTTHIFTYDLHRIRCGRLSLARSDTASAAATIHTRLLGFKQPREDLLSVIALKNHGSISVDYSAHSERKDPQKRIV